MAKETKIRKKERQMNRLACTFLGGKNTKENKQKKKTNTTEWQQRTMKYTENHRKDTESYIKAVFLCNVLRKSIIFKLHAKNTKHNEAILVEVYS